VKLKGTAHKYGDHVDTDAIIPAQHLDTVDPAEMAGHCMEDLDPDFVNKVETGDIIVAGRNFGCGSSREHAPIAIKASGISCVIAESFARIFYRNAFNIGLPIFECAAAAEGISGGDTVEVDADTGVISDHTTGKSFSAQPLTGPVAELVRAGGLIPIVRHKLQQRSS
jgi:3-isopropylmalate/(R)-2-methylmalate dehydratase small subunit